MGVCTSYLQKKSKKVNLTVGLDSLLYLFKAMPINILNQKMTMCWLRQVCR